MSFKAESRKSMSPQEKKQADIKRGEGKAANFLKLAPKRMTRALKAIEVVGNLANRNSYTYTDVQAAKIATALAEAVKAVSAKFSAPAGAQKLGGFTF